MDYLCHTIIFDQKIIFVVNEIYSLAVNDSIVQKFHGFLEKDINQNSQAYVKKEEPPRPTHFWGLCDLIG